MENYEKIKIIGRGACGTVFLCRRRDDNHLVAIKQIPVEDMTKEERQSALNEVSVLSRFQHPNIIRYFDSFVVDKALMIVMEYAQGGTIYDYLQQRRRKLLDEDEILRLFVQILLALQHVHKGNILHRDLKTPNILLNKRRKIVKIGDFGISKFLSSKSKANTVIGSPCYISPELCEGKSYNRTSDIWALGCVLYELVTLKRAFEASNLPALVLKIIRGHVSPVPERYSLELRKLILSMLSLDPLKRPSIPEIMAQPVVINALFDMATDVGRVPCTRIPSTLAGISAAIPPSRSKPTTTSGIRTVAHLPRTASSNSASTILEGLPDNLMSFSLKPAEPQHVVYHWGGGINTPTKLQLTQQDCYVSQVSAGRTMKTGVTINGSMILWEPSKSSLVSSENNVWIPRFLEGQSGVTIVEVSCGDLFVACLTDRGILMTYGSGMHGCLGHGNTNDIQQAKIVEALLGFEVEQVCCGPSHIMVVTADHEVFAWGRGDNGRLGIGSQEQHSSPQAVTIPEGFEALSVHCGIDCSVVITLDNKLLACGSNRCNKLALDQGNPVEESLIFLVLPQPLASLSVKAISMGSSHTALLTEDGKCCTFGSNSFGQLGYQREGNQRGPQFVESLGDKTLMHIACGDTFTIAISSENEGFSWGKGARGRLGSGSEADCSFPTNITLPAKLQVLSVSCSHSTTLVCGKIMHGN